MIKMKLNGPEDDEAEDTDIDDDAATEQGNNPAEPDQ
jgi:hypothetical protein